MLTRSFIVSCVVASLSVVNECVCAFVHHLHAGITAHQKIQSACMCLGKFLNEAPMDRTHLLNSPDRFMKREIKSTSSQGKRVLKAV